MTRPCRLRLLGPKSEQPHFVFILDGQPRDVDVSRLPALAFGSRSSVFKEQPNTEPLRGEVFDLSRTRRSLPSYAHHYSARLGELLP